MKTKIYSWRSKKLPNFNMIEACQSGLVVWWNEDKICFNKERCD